VTLPEFTNVMRRIMTAFWQLLADGENMSKWVDTLGIPPIGAERRRYEQRPPPVGGYPQMLWFPIWSFDHPPFHGGRPGSAAFNSMLQALGLPRCEVFDLPVLSYDIHVVPEDTHNRLAADFGVWLDNHPPPCSPQVIKQGLRHLF